MKSIERTQMKEVANENVRIFTVDLSLLFTFAKTYRLALDPTTPPGKACKRPPTRRIEAETPLCCSSSETVPSEVTVRIRRREAGLM